RLLRGALVLIAAGQLGDWALGAAGRAFAVSSHWTEWFDRDLVWGSWPVVIVTLVDTVVLTPIFEELVFRGLLFGTLRRRLGPAAAAAASAGVFALAHGYGVLGFAAVFWRGLLWAWAYERTGRLAVHVEDHPLEYADFEGVIPEGSYGAGPSIVWDRGWFRTLGDRTASEHVERGKLEYELFGFKLRGRWVLARMSGKERDWLLLKKTDAFADGDEPVDRLPESVLSGLTVAELREAPRK